MKGDRLNSPGISWFVAKGGIIMYYLENTERNMEESMQYLEVGLGSTFTEDCWKRNSSLFLGASHIGNNVDYSQRIFPSFPCKCT